MMGLVPVSVDSSVGGVPIQWATCSALHCEELQRAAMLVCAKPRILGIKTQAWRGGRGGAKPHICLKEAWGRKSQSSPEAQALGLIPTSGPRGLAKF